MKSGEVIESERETGGAFESQRRSADVDNKTVRDGAKGVRLRQSAFWLGTVEDMSGARVQARDRGGA